MTNPGNVIINFFEAVTHHISNGMTEVDETTQQERLAKCETCPFKKDNKCEHPQCGCYLDIKTKWASEGCPIGMWLPMITEEQKKSDWVVPNRPCCP